MDSFLKIWQRVIVLLAVVLLSAGCSRTLSVSYNPWQVVTVPSDAKLLDIGFTHNYQHGFLVGSSSTLLETIDGGNNWSPRSIDLEGPKFRFNSVSFADQDGWIVGEPALVLHTTDEGGNWSRVPLSEKFPGSPISVLALGPNSAELTTDIGAIYKTDDGGLNWKAQVEQAVGVIRNLERGIDGKYLAVSAKGNFYSIWKPGENAWEPHNRNSSRRVENMGFGQNGQLWMLARGGQIQFSDPEKPDEWLKPQYPEFSTSWGLLDLAYRTPDEVWLSGGSGNLLRSGDGGKTWEKDREVESVPANLYKIVFFNSDHGFIIGDRGILLKYKPETPTA